MQMARAVETLTDMTRLQSSELALTGVGRCGAGDGAGGSVGDVTRLAAHGDADGAVVGAEAAAADDDH